MRIHPALAFSLPLALVAMPAGAAIDNVFSTSFEPAWISGYHVGYQRDLYPLDEIDFASLTHLIVGRVTPNADGTLTKTFDIDAVQGPAWAQQATAAAHAASVKAILMIGGAGEHAGWVGAASPANRATFVANLLATMDGLGFDGLDLDWEPIDPSDEPDFIALAQALRQARPNMLLSVPVNWVSSNLAATPDPFYGDIAPLFDQINIMSYAMADGWGGWLSWHTAALTGSAGNTPSSIDTSVEFYLRSGVPRTRLGLGIPFFGSCWQGVTGPRQSGGFVVAGDGTITYRHIVLDYYDPGRHNWDAEALVPWLGAANAFGPAQCTFLSYDDEQSIAAKGAFARRLGLGGTIIWTIGEGHIPELPAGQRDPLLKAVRVGF